jgi:hypothetical protein
MKPVFKNPDWNSEFFWVLLDLNAGTFVHMSEVAVFSQDLEKASSPLASKGFDHIAVDVALAELQGTVLCAKRTFFENF